MPLADIILFVICGLSAIFIMCRTAVNLLNRVRIAFLDVSSMSVQINIHLCCIQTNPNTVGGIREFNLLSNQLNTLRGKHCGRNATAKRSPAYFFAVATFTSISTRVYAPEKRINLTRLSRSLSFPLFSLFFLFFFFIRQGEQGKSCSAGNVLEADSPLCASGRKRHTEIDSARASERVASLPLWIKFSVRVRRYVNHLYVHIRIRLG